MSESSDLKRPSDADDQQPNSKEDETSSVKSKARIISIRRRHQKAAFRRSRKVFEPKDIDDIKISLVFPRTDPQNA
ncbi:hypothetical protein DXZ20_19540 [Leptolyngbyaceae cyanobacterium CCMR0081]|uniref:Uncharacterized protein n=1 Tax=Adonisia turfae CCMR0081 TaxID=2292702 RepID=A0A6M0RND3_9CYAN|nr:hypothetical protein [Adonisia turfae CCMR0081]